ncbi:hypothetical protein RAS1_40710 [Phycisphaerae bacterium RAS1]|nr:hypothetical protein RAS1_40710 [Phycisphaerae bacterium RAS1]
MKRRTVAIVGASADRTKYSNKSVRAHVQQGWDVYPVNPKGGEVEGLKVYTSLRDVPVALDRVTIYLPPAVGVKLLPDIAMVKPAEFMVNPGAESDELLAEAERLGLSPILACSIVSVGMTPAELPER